MGIKLIVEIMDHVSDFDLTPAEWKCLIVLAEDANDQSRETWRSVNDPKILRRIGMSEASWKNTRTKLLKKGVLEYAKRGDKEARGHRGSVAKYKIAKLAPASPETAKGHRSDDPMSPDRGTDPMTQSPGKGHQSDDPTAGKGHQTDAERVIDPMTPTPVVPSRPSISVAVAPEDPPADGRTSLPEGFKLTDQMRLWATGLGFADVIDLDLHTDNFVDYYREHTEKKNRDWRLTWQRWMRNEYNRAIQNGAKTRRKKPANSSPHDEWMYG